MATTINPCTRRPYEPTGSLTGTTPAKRELIPLNDRVLIEPLIEDSFSKGGIVLAGDKVDSALYAIVLAVGPGKLMPSGPIKIAVKVGDKVIYGELNNTVPCTLNGKDVLLVVDQAIVAVVKES